METFSYQDRTFQTAVKTQRAIVAFNNDNCCTDIRIFYSDGQSSQCWAPKSNPWGIIGKIAAHSCKNQQLGCLIDGSVMEAPIKELLDAGQSVYTLTPSSVSGTSQGSVYRKIAQTDVGYIARREEDGLYNPRIRVVNQQHQPWPNAYQYTNTDTGLTWETVEKGHISAQAGVPDRAILLVARGLEILLRMQKG